LLVQFHAAFVSCRHTCFVFFVCVTLCLFLSQINLILFDLRWSDETPRVAGKVAAVRRQRSEEMSKSSASSPPAVIATIQPTSISRPPRKLPQPYDYSRRKSYDEQVATVQSVDVLRDTRNKRITVNDCKMNERA